LLSYTINLTDIFDDPPVTNAENENEKNEKNEKFHSFSRKIVNNDESEYVFRGFVCYYGSHYVSIFQVSIIYIYVGMDIILSFRYIFIKIILSYVYGITYVILII
jgi:hypothetical protein